MSTLACHGKTTYHEIRGRERGRGRERERERERGLKIL